LSHSASLALAVQAAAVALLPRTAHSRTDALAAFDDPPGEPRHRRLLTTPLPSIFSWPIAQ
jgi:hypothetical protein